MNKFVILDAVGFLFRSFYAIRGMSNPEGVSTNAIFGFIRAVEKVIRDFEPEHLVAIFDGPNNKASRVAIFPEYKAHREGMPEDLVPQLGFAIKWCQLRGIPMMSVPGVEADDVIGTITRWATSTGAKVSICSSDKDLAQLVTKDVNMVHTHKDNLIIDETGVMGMFGVRPDQIVDYLSITGDASDGIPGIAGLGPKAAQTLLGEYDTLENVLDNADNVKGAKKQEALKTHRDIALTSKQLATLDFNIPFEKNEAFFHIKEPDNGGLKAFYQEMHFMTLLKELGESKPQDVSYQTVDDELGLQALLTQLSKEKEICIDTETTGLDPRQADLVGVGFAVNPGEAWYIPCNGKLGRETVIQAIKPLLENPQIGFIGHNIKYDLHIFRSCGIEVANIAFDTMLASYIISPHEPRHNLDDLSMTHFGKKKIPIKSLIGTGKKQISLLDVPIPQVSEYCCEDVDCTLQLKKKFEKEFNGLHDVFYNIEMPLIRVLLDMEHAGIYLDVEQLQAKSVELKEKIKHLQGEIYRHAGREFNINSPKQLAEILFDELSLTAKKRSTAADILASIDHPIIKEILDYRTLEKLRSTYVDTLPTQVNPKTHRIHCTYLQTVAATGRLACRDPNLQNIPVRTVEGRKIREAFLPEKADHSFLGADYSQIELRLLAHFSEDPILLSAFRNHEDVHAITASHMMNVPLEKVTPEMRYQAKAVNFGIIYGQSSFGLSEQLGISRKEAAEFIKTYFERYPKVKAYLDHCIEETRETKKATTLTLRHRPIPDIDSKNGMIRSAAERLAVNTPLQGSQADIIKMAMLSLHKKIKNASMILQIHDELIFEVADSAIEALKPLVVNEMENIVNLKVPLTVNISVGKNWGEC